MATDLTVANTILAQLGGRKFVVMTGAKYLTGSESSLIFMLPKTGRDRANKWVITLTPLDTYTIDTYYVRSGQVYPKTHLTDIYNDQLRATFERVTGLATHL